MSPVIIWGTVREQHSDRTRDEVSVSTSRPRDGLETWFWLSLCRLGLGKIWQGLVSVSSRSKFQTSPSRLGLERKGLVCILRQNRNSDTVRPEIRPKIENRLTFRPVRGGVKDEKGRRACKLKSFEPEPTIRTEIMVKCDFRTLTYISADLWPSFSRNLSLPYGNPDYLLMKFGKDRQQ